MMITKSTTPDLIKMASRCDEYYRQQIKSSRRVFGASDSRKNHTSHHDDGMFVSQPITLSHTHDMC